MIDIPEFERTTLHIRTDHKIITYDPIVAKLRNKNYLELFKQRAEHWLIITNPDEIWVQHLTNNTNVKCENNQVFCLIPQ